MLSRCLPNTGKVRVVHWGIRAPGLFKRDGQEPGEYQPPVGG